MDIEFMSYYKQIGLKISYYRKLKGLTQENLAEILDVDTSLIGRLKCIFSLY